MRWHYQGTVHARRLLWGRPVPTLAPIIKYYYFYSVVGYLFSTPWYLYYLGGDKGEQVGHKVWEALHHRATDEEERAVGPRRRIYLLLFTTI